MTCALYVLLALPGAADVWTPPAEWLDRTMMLESSGNPAALGDYRNGQPRSRGPYQIQRRPWEAFGGRKPWATWAHDPAESRRVAGRILAACKRHVERHGQHVTFARARAVYRRGGY